MTQPVMTCDRDADWPSRLPTPDVTLAGGRVRLVERSGRQQGAVRLFWQPPSSARFWSERGRLAILVRAVLNAPGDRSRSLTHELEMLGVTVSVQETEFMCNLDLSGGHDELMRCAPLVVDALNRHRVTAAAISAAERRFAQERRGYRYQPHGAADAERWRGHVTAPPRVVHDHAAGDPDAAILGDDWSPIDGVVVVGARPLATAWAAAIGASDGGAAPAGNAPDITWSRPSAMTSLPARKGSQSLITYGAIEPLDTEVLLFDLELAVEILAGWSGSMLNQLFRHELAWSYGVRADIRTAGLGARAVMTWSVFLQTAPERAAAVVEHITGRARLLLAQCPTDTEVRHVARRVLRRELLWEDSVGGVMYCHGSNVQNGLPDLASRRWHHFTGAGSADLIRGVERMLDAGTFIVVGGPDADVDLGR